MFTRAEYMAFKNSDEMNVNHHRYYGEIAEEIGLRLDVKLIEECAAALARGDEHLNTIALRRWDCMVPTLRGATAALKARGDWLSLGTGVCILKEAARRQAKDHRPDFLALADRQIEAVGKVAQQVAAARGISVDAMGRVASFRDEIAAQMEKNFDAA